nr:DNA helicase [Tanacetum cinerariifolium]
MANTTPIVITFTKTANKEKTPKEADATLKTNILDFCGEYYEDILPVIMDKIRRDKRKEVHARPDFGENPRKSRRVREGSQNSSAGTLPARQNTFERLSNTYSPSTTKSDPDKANSRDRPHSRGRSRRRDSSSSRDRPRSRGRPRGIKESYERRSAFEVGKGKDRGLTAVEADNFNLADGYNGGGKVVSQWPRDPPNEVKELFRDKGFQENIRAYNQMFAMTSFGARIDDSVNKRRGPYLDPEIVSSLIRVLDEHNELVRLFRTARDRIEAGYIPDFWIRLFNVVGVREYDLPTSGTLGAIVFESGPNTRTDYDVIIESRNEMKQRRGSDKWISMNRYYMFQLHERTGSYGLLFRGGRLFQQYVVGVYCCTEQNRLDFYRLCQNDIKREYLSGVYDAICRGDREGSEIGGRIILPRTFTGGPRYMYSHCLDALAICGVLGNPQYFITFTCNVNWPEIKRHMQKFPELTPADRADAMVRVFQQKVLDFCRFLKEQEPFGSVAGFLIKYLFKYISMGTDKIAAKIVRTTGESPSDNNNASIKRDEIQNFMDGRFICPHEACWRILEYEIHSRQPAVQILCVHLENMQSVTFNYSQPLMSIVNEESKKKTTLTEWLEYNKFNKDGLHLTYIDFCKEFVWYPDSKSWRRRQRRTGCSIGRLTNIHPTSGEILYLRMLLCHQRGCKTFEDIRTVNKRLYPTFRAACEALGLLGDDKEWHIALEEAAFSATSQRLRSLFAQILIFCDVADPLRLWKSYWRKMSDDVPRTVSDSLHIEDLYMNDPEFEGGALYELEKTLINTMRSEGKIVLAIASLGIASLLLPAGRIAYLRFKLPLALTDESLCNIKKNTHLTTLRDILDAPDKLFGGKTIVLGEESEGDSSWITIPEEFCIPNDDNEMLDGESKVYTSSDEAIPVESDRGEVELLYPPDFLVADNMTANCISDMKPGAKNKILEAKGNVIQGNMGTGDIPYFESLLKEGSAYRITSFVCIAASKYQQTVDTETTLKFGRFTHFESIPADSFPKHYFNFVSYNQLDAKVYRKGNHEKQNQPTLTDYIGCLTRVGNIQDFGSANKTQSKIRRLDLENLKEEFEKMEQPVVFAVSSCKATIYGGIQLSGTPATHYYFNPDIPGLKELHDQYNFKAILTDESATALVTFSTLNVDVLTGSSSTQLVKKYGVPDPRDFPDEILSLNRRTHIFQIHYNPSCVKGRVDFYFDDILDKPLQIAGPSHIEEIPTDPLPVGTPTQLTGIRHSAQILTVTPLLATPKTPGTYPRATASIGATPSTTEGQPSDTPDPVDETTTKNTKRALFGQETPKKVRRRNETESSSGYQ